MPSTPILGELLIDGQFYASAGSYTRKGVIDLLAQYMWSGFNEGHSDFYKPMTITLRPAPSADSAHD